LRKNIEKYVVQRIRDIRSLFKWNETNFGYRVLGEA